MAKLPSAADLKRSETPAKTADVDVPAVKFDALKDGIKNLATGVAAAGNAVKSIAKARDEVDDYDTRKRLIDFNLETEQALEEHRRAMPPGAAGFAQNVGKDYERRAKAFFKTVPDSQRDKVDLSLVQRRAELLHRANDYELAEHDREHLAGLETQLGALRDAAGTDPSRRDEFAADGKRQIELSRLPSIEKSKLVSTFEKELDKGQAAARISQIEERGTLEDLTAFREALRIDQDDNLPTSRIGGVSAKYESGDRGVGLISAGRDDPGGPSYGVHQLSSKDSMPAFIKSPEGAAYAARFGKTKPGSAAFNRVYRELAVEDPDGFADAQYSFYSRTHYQPLLEHAQARGFNVADRGVQEALFSIAIQHGGARKIVDRATVAEDPEEQIASLYQVRSQYVASLDHLAPSIRTSIINRYRAEVRDAIALAGSSDVGPVPIEPGNIELARLPRVPNPDGSFSTVRSISVNIDGKEILIPTIDEKGNQLSDDKAVEQFKTTGRHLGKFSDAESANAFARRLSNSQGAAGKAYGHLSLTERKELMAKADLAWVNRQKALKAEEAGHLVEGWLAGSVPFNPMSKDGRKLLDDTLAESNLSDSIFSGDLAATTQGIELSKKLRYAPTVVSESITGLIRSGDDRKAALGYSAIASLLATSPNALDHVPGHEAFERDAAKFDLYRKRYGGNEAVRKMSEEMDPEKRQLRKVLENDAKTFADSEITEDTIREAMSRRTIGDWWSQPELAPNDGDRALMVSEFREVARREYELTGDKELATKLATQQFQKRHGVSEILGKRVMAYPPESFWPSVDGSYDYMKTDIAKEVRTYGPDAVPGSESLKFAGWTTDDSGRRVPSYWISWKKEDGRIGLMPRPWVPGYEAAEEASRETWQAKRQQAVEGQGAPLTLPKPNDGTEGEIRNLEGGRQVIRTKDGWEELGLLDRRRITQGPGAKFVRGWLDREISPSEDNPMSGWGMAP